MENIKLTGAKNTRDFGGIVNADGKSIKPHCFLRSAALNEISERDIAKLRDEYKLGVIIDLRTDTEIEEKPDVTIPGVEYRHIPIFDEETAGITHSDTTDKKELLKSLPDLCELYRTIVSESFSVEQLKKAISIILQNEGSSVLWHCTEGKDRCGIVSALVLLILDVPLETVYEDYLFTNNASSKNAKKYYRLVRYLMRDKESAEKIKRMFSAQTDFLDSAFDEIEKLYGSTADFIRDMLGVSDEMKENFKSKFLE